MPPTVDDWGGFFTAQLGAAATLGGLVFVGLSLNLQKILAAPALPNRALLAVFVLVGVLLASSFAIIPGQRTATLGMQLLVTGLFFAIFGGIVEIYTLRRLDVQNKPSFIGNMILLELAFIPYAIGGVLLIGGNLDGLYWVAGGVILSFIKAVVDSWVLVVEINR